ncbi:MAG TPA: NUDIX hydrolase [Solirubrobacteraceae bacterium]|nr:NUDIX hydrolase [Solirubrobacteraceae bacterium]
MKCVLRSGDGRALFVRHHYGKRHEWELPGGGAHRGEGNAQAARREAREELGADVAAWEDLGTIVGYWYGKDEELSVCAASWPGGAVRPDPVEIAAFAWFSLDAPPSPLGPTTTAALRVLRSDDA